MSWQKVKLGQFLKNREGRYKPKDSAIQGLKRIEKIDFSGTIYLSDKVSNTDMILVKKGDLVISGINVEKGAMNIYQGEEDVVATIHYSSYEFDEKQIDIDFLTNFLKSLEFKKALKEQVPGGIKTEIKPKHILPLEVEIPTDVEEQRKVVKKLNENNSIIEDVSSELTHQLDLIKQLRQAFLREAMQGKLCHAELVSASQETGHELLAKIKAEKAQLIAEKKIKKEKELPPITEDEIPFEIPEHWTWCRLGEICYTSGRIGWKGLSADEYQKSGPLFLSVHSLNYGDFVDYSKAFHITKERYDESPEIMLQNEDILICKDGAGIGKLGIIRNLTEPATINSSLLLIRKDLRLNTKFVYYFFLSSHFQKIVQERIMGATTPHLYQRDIVGFPFALPPLHEQERIVAKLEELMAFCDGLEESIKESQGYNEKLLQQVLREALQPQ